MMLMLELGFRFFCCGLFAIGGGLATLPFLYNISKETGWYTFSDISNMIAVSESTPGPMGVNMATYVGFHIKGILGGLAAPLSLVLPSVIIIVIISKILDKFKSSSIVQNALYGLRAASTALIAAAGIGVAKIAFLHVGEDGSLAFSELFSIINWKAIVLSLAIAPLSTSDFFASLTTALPISTQTQARMPAKALLTKLSSIKLEINAAIIIMMTSDGAMTPSVAAIAPGIPRFL